jgi:SagB-type dehydrogenase family enzyme
MNDRVRLAREFHDRTAHSRASVHTSGHALDWDIKPFPFKVYAELPAIPLPRALDPLSADTLEALGGASPPPGAPLTLDAVAAMLYFAAGVTKKKTYPGGGEVLFRAAASTGALFQTEVYLAAGDVEGLAPGLYHFCPGDFALRRLRDGDVRAALAAAGADESLARRAATLILSAIYWRNTWKYQARGYRHLFWDSGTMLANLLATAAALGAAPRLFTGFVDDDVNRLLGLDVAREAALELVALGPEGGPAAPSPTPAEPLDHPVMPLSSSEVDYPALREIHRGSFLETPAAVRDWRRAAPPPPRVPRGALELLPPPRRAVERTLGDTIQHRGSTREFGHEAISALELSTVLWSATRPVDADVPAGLVDLYLIVNAVDGVGSGAYRYWPEANALERLSAGEYRRQSAYLTLEQPLGGDAAAVIYFMAPLDGLLEAFGNRGYRLANLEAGIIGGRAYLAAYGQRFGASGLTFYDGDVVRFFSPHAAGLDAIFVTALGRSARR